MFSRNLCLTVLLACATSTQAQKSCGTERWPVKTLADGGAAAAFAAPAERAAVTDLVELKSPDRATLMRSDSTRFPEEMHKKTVEAVVLGFKRETDSDFHVVLALPENQKVTMIAELPAPECSPVAYKNLFAQLRQQFVSDFGKPTAKFKRLKRPAHVTVTGIFFFDFIHGQTGVAKNGAELHPVLDFSVEKPVAEKEKWQCWPWGDDKFVTEPTPLGIFLWKIRLQNLFGVSCKKISES